MPSDQTMQLKIGDQYVLINKTWSPLDLPIPMEMEAIPPNIMKALFFCILLNMRGAKSDVANLSAPWILDWYSGLIAGISEPEANWV